MNKRKTSIILGTIIALSIVGAVGALNGWFGGGASIPEDTFTRGLVGYWNMDEGNGALAKDSSSYANHGMVNDGGSGNPVSYWTFDETSGTTAYDSIGSNNGTLTNGPVWTSSGKVGAAISFDGTDDYVTVSDDAGLTPSSALTISAWIKPSASQDGTVVLKPYTSWATPYYSYHVELVSSDKIGFHLTTTGARTELVSTNTVNIGKWNHIVVKYTGSAMEIFINGSSGGTVAKSGSVNAYATALWFGKRHDGGNLFDGSIDDVRIYDYARAAAQIQRDYVESYKSKWVAGKVAGAMQFDGVDDSLEIPDDTSLKPQTITVEAWFNIQSYTGEHNHIVAKIGASLGTPGMNPYVLWVKQSSSTLNFGTRGDGVGWNEAYTSFTSSDFNKWHYAVGVIDGTNIKLYVDGQLKHSPSFTEAIEYDTSPLFIGADDEDGNGVADYIFDGTIDEVRIYNRALTAAEVKFHYSRGGPVGYWKFDEGTGTLVGDSTDNMNNAIIHGPSLDFDGTDDRVTFSISSITNFTAMGWIKTGDSAIAHPIAGSNGAAYLVSRLSKLQWYNNSDYIDSGLTIVDNTWHHFAFVFTGGSTPSTMRMFVDGVEGTSGTSDTYTDASFNHIGGRTNDRYVNGKIDEVHIYNRALSATEVKESYRGLFKDESGLVGYWPFDEEAGTTATDRSDESNNGTLTNMSGAADSGSTITLVDSILSATAGSYIGTYLEMTGGTAANIGLKRLVSAYNETTKTITCAAFPSAIAAADTYIVGWTPREGPTWTTGKYGNALSFDGTNDYLDAGSDSSLNITDAVTISAWVKMDDYTGNANDGIAGRDWQFQLTADTRYTGVRYNFFINEASQQYIITQYASAVNAWTHVVATYDKNAGNNNLNIYLDGVLDNSSTKTSSASPTENFWIGNLGAQMFQGDIDEVRIYDYARTADEIRLDYNAGFTARFGPHSDCDEDPGSCMTRDLVGYWNFDEGTGTKAEDQSGEGNDGTLGAGTAAYRPKWGKGKKGGALEFDGANDYVALDNTSTLEGMSELTVEAWINPSSTNDGSWHGIVMQNNSYHFQINTSGLASLYVYGPAIASDGSSVIPVNQWTHVTGTYDGTYVRWYENSQLISTSSSSSGNVTIHSNPLNIGGEPMAYGRYFLGKIDEVKIYSRALSATEIRYHYNQSEPVAHWSFDEGNGTTAYDQSDNGNDGTLKSSALDFDGVNDYVDCGNDSSVRISGNMTIETWVKPTIGADMQIVTKDSADRGFYHSILSTGAVRSAVAINTSSIAYFTSTNLLTTNKWVHIVTVYNGSTIQIFKDGALMAGSTVGSVPATQYNSGNNVWIGARTNGAAYTNGLIDEVRIYNAALSAAEIARHYNNDFSQDPTANLVMLHHFDESMNCDANDEVGCLADDDAEGVNDGTLKNFDNLTVWDNGTDGWVSEVKKSEWRWDTGKYGQAGSFNGWDDAVDIPDSSSLDITDAITIETWVNQRAGTGEQLILSKGFYGDSSYAYTLYSYKGYTSNGIRCYINSLNDYAYSPALSFNEWTHIACTYDKENIRIYINGVEGRSDPFTSAINTNNLNVTIGTSSSRDGNFDFDGKIDEVKIYNYARSMEEIRVDYNAGLAARFGPNSSDCDGDPGSCMTKGLVGYWPLNESRASLAKDESGYDNHGMFNDGGSGNPVSYWTFDEGSGTTATDYIGSNNGTLTNSPAWTQNGRVGGALSFDGTNDYVTVVADAFDSLYTADTFTISLWQKGPAAQDSVDVILIGIEGGYSSAWAVYYDAADDNIALSITGNFAGRLEAQNTTLDDKWHHIVFTYDGATAYIYIDGALDISAAKSLYDITGENTATQIGHSVDNGNYFKGSIDDIKIYDYARSATQIKRDYIESYKSKWVDGKEQGAMQFDGIDDWVEVEHDNSLSFGANDSFSVDWWMKGLLAEQQSSARFLEKGTNYYFYSYNTDALLHFRAWDGSQGIDLQASQSLLDDTWRHFVFVVDRSTDYAYLYVDGLLSTYDSDISDVDDCTNTNNLQFSYEGGAATKYFNGLMDDVKIYNRALSAEEIRYHYNKGGPVAYWKFNEGEGQTAYDNTDNNNDGTLGATSGSEASDPTWVEGKYGSALSFDGTDDYVGAGDGTSLNITNAITVASWLKLGEIDAAQMLLSKSLDTTHRYELYVNSENRLRSLIFIGGNEKIVSTLAGYAQLGVWYYSVATYDGLYLRLYVNGELQDSISVSGSIDSTSGANLYIGGKRHALGDLLFEGLIDEVKIYNYARTQEQILQDYNQGAGVFFK